MTRLHPLAKLAVCMMWIAASVLVFDPRFQLAAIALPVAILILVERRSPLLIVALAVPFALFGFGFLTTSLLFRQESDFAVRMAGESLFASERFSAGITLFLRAIACGMISALFALTTDAGAFIRALMNNLRLPAPIGYALFSAMNLVPDLAGEIRQIRLARAMRTGRPPRRLPGPVELFSLVVPLLAFAIRRAGRSAIAMEARGLGANARRTVIHAPRARPADFVFLAAGIAILAAALAAIAVSGSVVDMPA